MGELSPAEEGQEAAAGRLEGASPSGVLPQPPSSSTSGCWAGAGTSPPGHTAPAPPQETRSVWVDVRRLSLPGLWQKSPSCPRTTAQPTAAPSGRSSASSCRSSSWVGSTSCASVWCASATPVPTGPSRTSTLAGPPTCPSTSSPPAAPSTVPSQVRSLSPVRALEEVERVVRAGCGARGSEMLFGLDLSSSELPTGDSRHVGLLFLSLVGSPGQRGWRKHSVSVGRPGP